MLGASGSALLGFLEAVAFGVDVDDLGAVDETIDERDDASGAREDLGPLGGSVNGGTQEFSYTEFGLPWKVTTGTVSSQTETHFEYDAKGGRVARRTPMATTIFAGEAYERLTEVTAPGRSEHTYRVTAYGREIAQFVQVVDAGQVVASAFRYLHHDAIGTTTMISGESGNAEIRSLPEAFGASQGSASGFSVDTGFTGHRVEDSLGLINMRGRFYDPRVGRFLTPDPFVFSPYSSQGLNRYSYVRNNPVTRCVIPRDFRSRAVAPDRTI